MRDINKMFMQLSLVFKNQVKISVKTSCCYLKKLTQIQYGGFKMAAENRKTLQNVFI